MAKGKNREVAKEQGFFDGRFRQRSIENKKRKQQLKDSRKKYGSSDF
jgi:hypothetical protein